MHADCIEPFSQQKIPAKDKKKSDPGRGMGDDDRQVDKSFDNTL